MKTYSIEELKAVTWVQNISGAIIYLGDLSPTGDEGKGKTLRPNEVLELKSVIPDERKVNCLSLRRGLEGIEGGSGFDPIAPVLQAIDGPEDPRIVKKVVKGTLISKDSPRLREANIFDVTLMEQNVKEMEEELETTQNPSRRGELQSAIENLKGKIDIARKSVKTGVEANVVEVEKDGQSSVL